MTDTRARLLEILKESWPYSAQESTLGWAAVDDTTVVHHILFCSNEVDAVKRSSDLNARHRLKRMCEECAAFIRQLPREEPCGVDGDICVVGDTPEEIAAAILALGEDNDRH